MNEGKLKKLIRILIIGLPLLLVVILMIPFFIPVPALENTQPISALADKDSLFVTTGEYQTHYKTMGDGETVFILLHGFGASVYSWDAVMEPMAELGTVYAYDRPAFGLTERLVEWDGQNPYSADAAVEQLILLLQAWGVDQAILVGNSAGGGVAIRFAEQYPEKVEALILISPATGGGKSRLGMLEPLFNLPQFHRLGPLFVRSIADSGMDTLEQAWHDPSLITERTIEEYRKPLQAENWDIALWEYTLAYDGKDLKPVLENLTLPILFITGIDDRIVPTQNTIDAAGLIEGAPLVVLENCGHVPQEECPDAFMEGITSFLDTIK